jgi:SAM-dependent methyltransferase
MQTASQRTHQSDTTAQSVPHGMDHDLLRRFIEEYPSQPATAFLRSIEIAALVKHWTPQGRGLDLGCGDAKLTRIISERTVPMHLVGLDPDPLESHAAIAAGLYETVHTAFGNAIPEPDGAFDYVLSNSVLEHIPELTPVIAEVSRVLRPGGELVFSVPTVGFRSNMAGAMLPWTSREDYLDTLDRRTAHIHYLDREQWKALLARYSMRVEFCFGYLDKSECQRWETLSRWTGGLLYALAGGRKQPIELQRALGLRHLQNKAAVPRSLASLIGRMLSIGHATAPAYWDAPEGLPDSEAGCLLIRARRD